MMKMLTARLLSLCVTRFYGLIGYYVNFTLLRVTCQ